MCGIAGVIDPTYPAPEREVRVGMMCNAMQHRGPDDGGIETFGPATLGSRRLAIFDPANGHQPMPTADGRFHIVFNGAILNFRDLRNQLIASGFAFHTECDTEVLVAAYAHWGEDCIARLRGMFALAIWDSKEESLFLARDAFGIKPLYYRHDGERLLFASELNGLLAGGLIQAEIDPLSVADYLGWFAVPAPRTIYRGIFTLRPAEFATFRRGRLEIRSSWDFHSAGAGTTPCRSVTEFGGELRRRMEDTIQAHVLADVPVGAFLSGGLDSAVVVGLMTQAAGARLKTFSIGFTEAGFDESSAAETTARHFGTEHHTRILSGAEVAANLSALLASYDQPTGDGINTYFVSQTARAGGVTVALSGLGGDELLGGYPSFRDIPRLARWLPLWWKLPNGVRQRVLGGLMRRNTRMRKLADILENAHTVNEVCSLQRRVFSQRRRRELLSGDLRASLAGESGFHPELATLSSDLAEAGLFETVSAWELRTYMGDVLLRDSDVMSMRHSLELRVPFVDRPLIEWLWRQPEHFKHDRQHPKAPLAEVMRDLLPPGVQSRRKQGFTLPFALWMRKELRPFLDATFSAGSVDRSGLFDRATAQAAWSDYLSSNDTRQWSRVWALAVLIDFSNRRTVIAPSSPLRAAVVLQPRVEPLREDEAPVPPVTTPLPRRTLLLAPEIFASEGGIPRILQTYLKALCDIAAPQDSVRFVALNDAQVKPDDLARSANARLSEWRVCDREKSRFVRGALELSRGCDRLICGHVAQLPVALLARMLHPRLRYYLVAHGIEVWRPFTVAERLALRGATRIFCVSDYTRQELLRNCPLEDGRAIVLPNALDPYFEIGPGIPRNGAPPVILVITRITKADRYKGVEHMVEAMAGVTAKIPGARLRIIGRGDDLERLHQLRDALGLTATIEFLGYVDDARLAAELRACSLFALPSKKEGFGLVFLEAMANGRPCLGARAGGVPEVISEDTGVLVEYGDVPALAEACVAALHRTWDESAILARAREFSYSPFKAKLASLLDA